MVSSKWKLIGFIKFFLSLYFLIILLLDVSRFFNCWFLDRYGNGIVWFVLVEYFMIGLSVICMILFWCD